MAETKEPVIGRVFNARPGGSGREHGSASDGDSPLVGDVSDVAALADRLRDLEKALVERIADVDDDRRMTANQLQRAWQTQREEMDERLERVARVFLIVLVLVALLGVGGVVGVYWLAQSGRSDLDARIAAVEVAMPGPAAPAPQDDAVKAQLAEVKATLANLRSALSEMSDTDSRVASAAAQSTAAETSARIADLGQRIERLATEQGKIAAEIESLRSAPKALVPTQPSAPDVAPSAAPASASSPTPAQIAVPTASAAQDAAQSPGLEPPAPARTSMTLEKLHFAVQLMGSYDRQAIDTLAKRLDLTTPLYLREDVRRGRPWFALILGPFQTRSEAKAALAALPHGLTATKPWVRALRAGTELEPVEGGATQ